MARKITVLHHVTPYPVCWPDDKPRVAYRTASPFKTTQATAEREIREELPRWNIRESVLSMAPAYIKRPDPGVALWFNMPGKAGAAPPELSVLACDTYSEQRANLHAIYLTLDRLRSLERYGTYSLKQAMAGARLALPAPGAAPAGPPWWETLGCPRDWPLDAIKLAYQQRAREAHPDNNGGAGERMAAVNAAWEDAKREKAE